MLSSVRRPPPQVTGISPKEGIPGTRVTIRGENLGVDARDLIGLRICGVDCLLSAEWKSPNKIIARTGQAKGKGEIIVCTRSGGVGSSTVLFRGYNIQIGPQQESAVWIDETQVAAVFGRNRANTPLTTEHDDPLGISDESNDKKFSEDKLLDMFPEGSGNTALENFEPAWFLLENHHCTGFDDLKAGLAHLKRKSTTRSEGPREFVKTNLTTFLDCYDTLTEMNEKIESDMTEGSVTQPLEGVLQKSNESAVALFYDVLARKDRADATRNALGVLQRFKFLFNLPCTMDKNIKKGDYDLVITDYTRAKSLFGDSEVKLFRTVYEEVERRIKEFREMLYKKLLQLPATVDDQKKTIRYLGHLDMPGDPAWECLVNMQKWQLSVLNNCKDRHIAKELERQKELVSGVATSPLLNAPLKDSLQPGGTKCPQKIRFVEELTKILTDNMPDIWRLGQAYFSGKLLKEVKNAPKVDVSRRSNFNSMIKRVVEFYSRLVRAAFLPRTLKAEDVRLYGAWADNKKDSPSAWLPTCVRYTRTCTMSLSADLPNECMEILQQLAFDMRANCMTLLLKQAIENVKNLHMRETWLVDRDDERGGTTALPSLFENLVTETLQHLQEVIHVKQGETELFSEPEIQAEAVELCIHLLQSFAVTADQLAQQGNVDPSVRSHRSSIFSPVEQYALPHLLEPTMPSYDKRLIIMMSNCAHTKKNILPRLVENLEKHQYPETTKVQAAAAWRYQSLDERLFDKYIEEKANPISGVLEQNMYAGLFDWNNCSKPKGVRTYVKEALMGIIQVHAEVYSFCPSFVSRVMYHLIEYIMNEISRLFQCVPYFCHNGAVQGRLEIYALDAALGYYKTDETVSALKEALNCIPEIEQQDERDIRELLLQFKAHHKFMLTCFQPDKRVKNSQF